MKRKVIKQFMSQDHDITYYVGDIIVQSKKYPNLYKKTNSVLLNEITDYTLEYNTIEINDIDILKHEVLSFKSHFYNGGGDTDELEAEFEEKLNELIDKIRSEKS